MKKLASLVLGAFVFSLSFGVAQATPQEMSGASEADYVMQQELIRAANAAPIELDKGSSLAFGAENGVAPKAPYGSYPRRKGVILVTSDSYKGLIPLGHSAIIYAPYTVIESDSRGVVYGESSWWYSKAQAYGVTVRGTTAAQDAKAADWVRGQLGKPYNYNYLDRNTRSKFHCSQLVWAAFKDNFNIDLDTWRWGVAIRPMELVQTDRTSLIWRKK